MALDITSIPTEEKYASPVSIVNGTGRADLTYLRFLRRRSLPVTQNIIDEIGSRLNLRSELSSKSDKAAEDKSTRPSTLERYPWFTLAHLRDYLRFRTHIEAAGDFEAVISLFLELERRDVIGIVKIDTIKLFTPGAFGWRMIATDIRIVATGMLVEHYMTFSELIRVNEEWLHAVYEAWRSTSTDDLTLPEVNRFYGDARFSTHAYRELLLDGLLRGEGANSTLKASKETAAQAILNTLKAELNLP